MVNVLFSDLLSDLDPVRDPVRGLCNMLGFKGTIRVGQEFSEGFTETRVFLAEHQESPEDAHPHRLVFKVGPGGMLRDEVRRYQELREHARAEAAFVKMRDPERTLKVLPADANWGAIAYDYAAAALAGTSSVSLKRLFKDCLLGSVSEDDVDKVLATTVRALGSLYANPETRFADAVAAYYLDRWAPDFEMKVECLAKVTGVQVLTLRERNTKHFSNVQSSSTDRLRQIAEIPSAPVPPEVVLRQLAHSEIWKDTLRVPSRAATDLSLMIDVTQLSPAERKSVAGAENVAIWAPAGRSRHAAYHARLASAFPGLDLEARSFSIGGVAFHNPLCHLSKPLLDESRLSSKTRMAPAHGDLHPGNVLVVGTTPVIIDFGLAEKSLPIGVDAARLFGGLVRDVAAEELSLNEVAQVVGELMGLEPATSLGDQAKRALHVLAKLAAQAPALGGPDSAPLWPLHVYGYGLIGLKWNGSSVAAYQASFLLAAAALTSILGSPSGTSLPWPTAALVLAPSAASSVLLPSAVKPIKPEGAAEILVLVATFAGTAEYDPTTRIYTALADQVFEIIPGLARVERVFEVVSSRKDALVLGQAYKASMVVWGNFDGFGILPKYEVTRDSIILKRSMLQLDQATRLGLGEKFEPYVTHELPNELSFLSLVTIGEICLLNLNISAAITTFEAALQLVGDSTRARALGAGRVYYRLAALLMANNQYDKALANNARALEFHPDNVVCELQQVRLVALRSTGSYSSMQNVEVVRNMIQRQLARSVNDEERGALTKALDALLQVKTSAEADKILVLQTSSASSLPRFAGKGYERNKDVIVHINHALECFRQSKYNGALKRIKIAMRINPRCAMAWAVRAMILGITDDVQAALSAVQKAIVYDPSLNVSYYVKARICLDSGTSLHEALQNMEKAFELGYSREAGFLCWGEIMVKLGRGYEVLQFSKDHPQVAPMSELLYLRSMYYRQQGAYSIALREAGQGLELFLQTKKDRVHGWHHYEELGEVYLAMGERELGLTNLTFALDSLKLQPYGRRVLETRIRTIQTHEASSAPVVSLSIATTAGDGALSAGAGENSS